MWVVIPLCLEHVFLSFLPSPLSSGPPHRVISTPWVNGPLSNGPLGLVLGPEALDRAVQTGVASTRHTPVHDIWALGRGMSITRMVSFEHNANLSGSLSCTC